MDEDQKLDRILQEIESFKERLAVLERASTEGLKAPDKQGPVNHVTFHPQPLRQSPSSSGLSYTGQTRLKRGGLENLIGKSLLNRIGIIVLLVAVAYFLKYSFDNNWSGPLGRIAIGYLVGVSFLIAGDFLIRRKYHYFAQSISGGGIAIIYLTTFSAVSFYHLIPSIVALALLVLTTLTGGLPAVRQNALGLVFIATLGGFLSPFLIGSHSGNLPALMTYISILDLAVLFLAYYKNWRFLNALALVSTILVYIVYHTVSVSSIDKYIGIQQVFLFIFWLIFSSLSFLYNLRRQASSLRGETILTLANANRERFSL